MAETTGNEQVSDIYRAHQTKLFIGEVPKDGEEQVSDIYRAHQTKLSIGEVPKDGEEYKPPMSAPLTTPVEPESVFPPDKKEP